MDNNGRVAFIRNGAETRRPRDVVIWSSSRGWFALSEVLPTAFSVVVGRSSEILMDDGSIVGIGRNAEDPAIRSIFAWNEQVGLKFPLVRAVDIPRSPELSPPVFDELPAIQGGEVVTIAIPFDISKNGEILALSKGIQPTGLNNDVDTYFRFSLRDALSASSTSALRTQIRGCRGCIQHW